MTVWAVRVLANAFVHLCEARSFPFLLSFLATFATSFAFVVSLAFSSFPAYVGPLAPPVLSIMASFVTRRPVGRRRKRWGAVVADLPVRSSSSSSSS